MDILELIKILRNKFTKKKFFVRVYHIEDNIIIYNDVEITLKYNVQLFDNIDKMVNIIINDVKKKIEEKYSVPNEMVSVIIPNYNNDIFLKKTISKIIENTYKNIEIIIVDDKSIDNSIDIIKSFENEKIKIYENKENSGTYYSRNKGILMSKGGYILVVDGDDYIDSTYIENMVNGLKNYGNNVWGYGKHFERVYLNSNLSFISKKKSLSYNILFKRKLFNYLGFFQNSRFGADTEYIFRAQIYKYPIKFDHNNNNIQYHANSIKNKNLTRTINWNKRSNYISQARRNIYLQNYIEMAYLD
jgi:glycosyltransferase involved in cell wall biosynthesis